MSDDFEAGALDLLDRIAAMSDVELLGAYQRTDGEPDNPVAALLCDEIQRRGLDI
jgi:hypothetical protein